MSTELAEQPTQPKPMTIRDRLKSPAMIAELGKAMPKHCDPDRMARVALTAITRTPKLAECDEASFFRCMLDLSAWGLEPDGRRAHLIPFRNNKRNCIECQLIIDYKGLVELAYRSGIVGNIHADVVRDGDIFEYDRGQVRKHTPWYLRRDEGKPEKAGDVFAVYCLVELSGGACKCEVLPKADVEKIRGRSRAGRDGPWVTDWEEMAKKTAFRRVSKWLPLSAEIHDAFEKDADRLPELPAVEAKAPATLEGLTQLLHNPAAEEFALDMASEQSVADDLPESSYDPQGDPEEKPDEWTQFNNAVKAAKTLADLTHATDYWLQRDFGSQRNTEALTIVREREAAIRAGKGKQKPLLDKGNERPE